MTYFKSILVLSLSVISFTSFPLYDTARGEEAKKEHAHDEHGDHDDHKESEAGHDDHEGEHAHGEFEGEEGHGDHDDHGHGEAEEGHEEGGNIGPDKGVLSYNEKTGFVLSPEATRTFAIESKELSGAGSWTVTQEALVYSTSNLWVYRIRGGAYKAVSVAIISKSGASAIIRSSALRGGDFVAVKGAAYLRLVELDATSGEVGHSH